MESIKEILGDLGLSKKEAEVYLALLKLEEGNASRISEIADLNRVTTYTILKSLKEKGFCSVYEKNNVQYFKPVSPENILSLIEEKKTKIKSIIPQLKKYEKVESKPEISLYEGRKGIMAMLDAILKDAENKKEVFAYGNVSVAEKLIEYESLQWRKTRTEKKIKIKAIINEIPSYIKSEKELGKLREVRIERKLGKINCYVFISENFVAYLTFNGEITGILVKSREVVEKERFNFGLI